MVTALESYRGFIIRRHDGADLSGQSLVMPNSRGKLIPQFYSGAAFIICVHCPEGGKETYRSLDAAFSEQLQSQALPNTNNSRRGYLFAAGTAQYYIRHPKNGRCNEDSKLVVAVECIIPHITGEPYLSLSEKVTSVVASFYREAIDSLWVMAMRRSE